MLLTLCFIISMPVAADDITEFVLPNGLKLVIKPDQRSPIIVFQIWYKVGSANEQKGNTGISHLLEHLTYRGNKKPFSDKVYRQMSTIGSKGNAYTSRDYTFYYHILANKHLSRVFAVEAQRMKYLNVDQNAFDIETNVIWQERLERISRDPYLKASNALYKIAFKNDSYQFPVIGLCADHNKFSLRQANSWHKNYYTPDNATIVVVGDVNHAEVIEQAKKYFAPIKKHKQTENRPLIAKQENLSQRRFIMPENIKVGMIFFAFPVPSIKTAVPAWEAYALDVLAGWFDSGNHSRLTNTLVRNKKVAHEVFVNYSPMNRKNSLFVIEASPVQGISLQQLEKAMIDAIQQIKQERISDKTLQKVKNQMIATEIFDRDSMYTQAKIIGQAESVGIHWSEDAQYIERIKAVTSEQINTVLQKYIKMEEKFVVIQNSYHDEE
ncbi:MAG: insulinase family protein [gamma proteobacterium symbiont of Bathyaustriella thionipta]|nr:insulinase family protein [gamma proteobacterium symbiont of Bathyaustriella thionipta]MCU7954553.1 insulinase family protein [gamma proteobacterium symbiont of Bathyaustriella thionipta]MCU7966910.1 insulinase family protein [gamma proteobacterium symbiont of Bathyaustriella thionipta]